MGRLIPTEALIAAPGASRVIDALWGGPADTLPLWHGGTAPVAPGDRVYYYEQADGTLVIVGIGSASVDAAAGAPEVGDGDA